jgi:hypothetical protein
VLSERTFALAKQAAEALLGVDLLYRAESGERDGLVVLNMDAEQRIQPVDFASYGEARASFQRLKLECEALPEPDRRMYYRQLCDSTLAFIAWRAHGLSFASQLSGFLHVPAEPASEAEIAALCKRLRTDLSRMGFTGELRAQCAAWEERNRVAPDDVPSVMSELLEEAWTRTEQTLQPVPASRSDGMRVVPVTEAPFNARCDYLARRIELNVEPTLTRPGLKHLAVHEAVPGHYLQFKLRETMAREGTAAADVLFSVVNTASSCVFEGIADAGMRMIDWESTGDDRVQSVLNRHRAAIGTGAAWRLHAEGWSIERVTDWLRTQSLTGGEGWIRNRMRFIASPARAVLIWSYWWGEPSVASAWQRMPAARRAEFLPFLFGRMHSPQTVSLFE